MHRAGAIIINACLCECLRQLDVSGTFIWRFFLSFSSWMRYTGASFFRPHWSVRLCSNHAKEKRREKSMESLRRADKNPKKSFFVFPWPKKPSKKNFHHSRVEWCEQNWRRVGISVRRNPRANFNFKLKELISSFSFSEPNVATTVRFSLNSRCARSRLKSNSSERKVVQ